MSEMPYRVSVDIGGTFTDLVILDERSGRIQTLKVSSTPSEPTNAVLNAVVRARDQLGIEVASFGHFTHASTVGSNCILEGLGAKTGLITTEGFRDILALQRHKRFNLFDLNYHKIPPLVPGRWAFGVPERVSSEGNVVEPLDEAVLRAVLAKLANDKVEALAICFLFSFLNPEHEKRAAEIAREIIPGCFITCSSDVYPQFREYERASTAAVNAYLGPRVGRYLSRMCQELEAVGLRVPLHLMQSNGGVISWREASQMPCRVVELGPAAGVIAAAHFGRLAGRSNIISFDMGGTTAKAGLIENGEVRQSDGQEVGAGINVSRLLQGGGYYIGAATVDLAEVGAGGGSIAWLDGGVLKVGPKSAGADPGPIAYGIGGDKVTVTDANLLLGRIPADAFLGGEMRLDLDQARRVVEQDLAKPLGISIDEACAAVVDVANANMLKMLRIVSLEKGYDPADFSMVVFGGNGPVHGTELAEDLGVNEVLVPLAPGLLSAQGLLAADVRYDFRQTHLLPLYTGKLADLEQIFASLEAKGRAALETHGIAKEAMQVRRSAEMRYLHQAYEVTVEMPPGSLSEASRAVLAEAFHSAHERRYGRRQDGAQIEIVTVSVAAASRTAQPTFEALKPGDRQGLKPVQTRTVYFKDIGRVSCPHFDRARLGSGDVLQGPAIIQAKDSTTVVLPGWQLECDTIGNLILSRKGRGA